MGTVKIAKLCLCLATFSTKLSEIWKEKGGDSFTLEVSKHHSAIKGHSYIQTPFMQLVVG